LPALDLPISRTGLVLYYPPLFRVSAEPGAFRPEAYAAPTSPAFHPTPKPLAPVTGAVPVGEADKLRDDKNEQSTQLLIDEFRTKSKAGRVAGILPVSVDFPAFGP